MRNIVCIMLAIPVFALAVNLQPVTVVPEEGPVTSTGPLTKVIDDGRGGESRPLIGTVDTVGGSTYDWQWNGPAYRALVNSPGYGVHVAFMMSASNETTFPDRNMRYNFYDYSTRAWNWIDPDFMQSGVNVYTERSGFGNMDADPATGVAIVSAHNGSPIHPTAARDMAPGAGLFEYCSGAPNNEAYQWPYISVGREGEVQCALIDEASADMLFYSKADPWCTWSDPVGMAAPQPDPLFPNQNIAASKVSDKVCVTWVNSPDGATTPRPGFYRVSTDDGQSWANPEELPWPDAFGGDTSTSYHITSLFPFYDSDDELHIVANVMPYVDGSGYIIPAQIWHRCITTGPTWCHIATATCDPANLGAAVGYNAMYACRPNLGEDANGNLFVAWEQFDSANVEPGPPEVLRADIFYSYSTDNGNNWAEAMKLTEGGTVTHRFPAMLSYITDTVMVSYLIDTRAGFFIQGEGPATNNPYVVQKWENPLGGGINEEGRVERLVMEASATPNPFDRQTRISYAVPNAGDVSLKVFDIAGRPVRTLVSGRSAPGRFNAAWNGRDDNGSAVAAGVYLYEYVLGNEKVTGKLLLTQ